MAQQVLSAILALLSRRIWQGRSLLPRNVRVTAHMWLLNLTTKSTEVDLGRQRLSAFCKKAACC